jgi:Site-specific recombinase XerD
LSRQDRAANLAFSAYKEIAMSQKIAPAKTTLPPALAGVADTAREYMLRSRAGNTRRAYGSDWRDFAAWCADAGLEALPARPETIGLYLAARASTHRPATLDRRLIAITAAHRAAGHGLNTRHAAIRETLAGIKRTHGTAPDRQDAGGCRRHSGHDRGPAR